MVLNLAMSAHTEELVFFWTEFYEISHWEFLVKFVLTSRLYLRFDKNIRYFRCTPFYICCYISPRFVRLFETCCVLCELRAEIEEKVDDLDINVEHERCVFFSE